MALEDLSPYFASHPVFDTTSAEQVEHATKSLWQANSFSTANGGKGFHGVGRRRQLSRIDLAFCFYNSASEIDFGELPFVRQQFVLTGTARSKIGHREFAIDTTASCVLQKDVRSSLFYNANYQQITVRIPPATLDAILTALLGALPRNALRFKSTLTIGPDFERLRRFVLLMANEVDRTDVPDVLLSEYQDMLVTQFLIANDHNHRDSLLARPTATAPKHVRMVEEYIVANWEKPFTIEDVARITGMSARTIYATFRQHRGFGPKTFLRQMRLNKAREMLMRTGMDVAAIAKACGFSNAGHFARYYRLAFGELPSDTMR